MDYLMRTKTVVLIALLTAVCLGAIACAPATQPEEPDEEKEPVVIVDEQWQTMWINNDITAFIIEHGFGYPVEITTLESPVAQQSLEDGDAHIKTEVWQAQVRDWWEGALDDGTVLNMGPIMESSAQGWYVPDYVIEGDEERGIEPMAPGLESVHDLDEYTDVFPSEVDPDRGVLLAGIAGWEQTVRVNESKLHAYGLDDHYETQEPGSAAALDSAIAGAYERGEPILAYYWEPTWLLGAYDMIRLEEPEHDQQVWEKLQKAAEGEMEPEEIEKACAFPDVPVLTGVHAGLQDRAPEVVDFLDEMLVGTQTISEVAAYMELEDKDSEEGAMWFFENYEEKWRDWLPEDVEEKVAEALREEGLDISE